MIQILQKLEKRPGSKRDPFRYLNSLWVLMHRSLNWFQIVNFADVMQLMIYGVVSFAISILYPPRKIT